MTASSASQGERDNARKLYYELLEKYELTEDDIVDQGEELYQFHCANKWEKRLLFQIEYKVTGKGGGSYYHDRSNKRISIMLTKIDYQEINLLYSIYRKELPGIMEKAYYAFIMANNIYPGNGKDVKDLTEEEIKELQEIMRMSLGIEPTFIPRALLGESE